jgi:hypothetical protein
LQLDHSGLEDIIRTLGSVHLTYQPDQRSRITVRKAKSYYDLLLEVPPAAELGHHDRVLSTASIPAFSFLLERWQLDHLVWDALLPHKARGSLPGRCLLIHGYDYRGRSIAWRARAIGMNVLVAEGDLQRRLDASYDGFEIFTEGAPPDHIAVYTHAFEGAAGLCPFAPPSSVPVALTDEYMALSAIALSAIGRLISRQHNELDHSRALKYCDHLLLATVAAVRTDYDVSCSAYWPTYCW